MATTSLTLIKAFASIWQKARRCGLSSEFFASIKPQTDFIQKKLGLKAKGEHLKIQCVMLSMLIDVYEETMTCKDMANLLEVSNILMLTYNEDLVMLKELRMINTSMAIRHGERQMGYSVSSDFLEAVKANETYVPRDLSEMTPIQILRLIEKQLDITDNYSEYYDQMVIEVNYLLQNTRHTEFSHRLLDLPLKDEERILFLTAAVQLILREHESISRISYGDILEESFCTEELCKGINEETGSLSTLDLLENTNSEGIKDLDRFTLTDNALKTVLKEFQYNRQTQRSYSDESLIKPESIAVKQLFYNEEEGSQIKRLADIIDEKRFSEVQKRLQSVGRQPGICALLHGVAGGGKTETVYQLARQTGRSIFMVDVSELKSKWVGESEKQVKALFDKYEQKVKDCTKRGLLVPILLFNEADAIMGRRTKGAEHSIDKMENAVQNIILQAMEKFTGIMIATSNLADTNLDGAFDRRFLIKVNFKKPSIMVKSKIWQSVLHDLSEKDALVLSSRFDFTGGEIDNVVRKLEIDNVLYEQEATLEHIISVCQEEYAIKPKGRGIGFCA